MVTLHNVVGIDVFPCGWSQCGWIVNTRKNLLRVVTKFRAEVRALFRYCWDIKHCDTIFIQFFRGHSISQSPYKVTGTPADYDGIVLIVSEIKSVSVF